MCADLESDPAPAGMIKLFKGHMAELLRHPQGCDVLTDLYDVASSAQRNAMVSLLPSHDYCWLCVCVFACLRAVPPPGL